MASVTITSSALTPNTKTVLCRTVTVGFKRDLVMEPYANGGTLAEVQTQSQENLRYSLQNVHLLSGTVASTLMSYSDWMTLAQLDYDGTNAPLLTVTYGLAGSTNILSSYAGSTDGIPVVVESFNANLDASDSKDSYRPTMTVNLVETG